MRDRYFDDFEVGDSFTSGGATLSEAQILDFALTYDPQPIHVDAEAAAEGPYGGLIASGFQTLMLAFRLFYQENIIRHASLGGPGMDEIRWLSPVRPGDTIRVVARVAEKRPSRSRPDRGTLIMKYDVRNQRDEQVMTYDIRHILRRREPA